MSAFSRLIKVIEVRTVYVCVCGGRGTSNVADRYIYDGWNFNSGNYLFTTDTK